MKIFVDGDGYGDFWWSNTIILRVFSNYGDKYFNGIDIQNRS
jgi:hypothetical protein